MTDVKASHPDVIHPRELIAREGHFLKKANDYAALRLAAFYGAAITIWLFAAYSLCGALVSDNMQSHMLYWSNAAQLVFCPLMVYVGNLLSKSQKAKEDTDHQAQTHIATTVDAILEKVNSPGS